MQALETPGADGTTPPLPLTTTDEQGTPAPPDHAAALADALAATDVDATSQAMVEHGIMATSDTAAAGLPQSGDPHPPTHHADDSDEATAHAATHAVAGPPPYLHQYDQAAHRQASGPPK